jgi:hypothetical protein
MFQKLIGGFVVILVGVSVLNEISSNIKYVTPLKIIKTKENKNYRQTYEEYVRERLRVEKMVRW